MNGRSDPQTESDPQAGAHLTSNPTSPHPQNLRLSRASLLALTVYATCWTLPALGNYTGRFGYLDLARYLATYRTTPHISR